MSPRETVLVTGDVGYIGRVLTAMWLGSFRSSRIHRLLAFLPKRYEANSFDNILPS